MDISSSASLGTQDASGGLMPATPTEVKSLFRDYLDSLGFTQNSASQAQRISEYGLLGWAQKDLELKLQEEARAEILAEKNLTEEEFGQLSYQERMALEALMDDRLKEKMAQAIKDTTLQEMEREASRLYRQTPLLKDKNGDFVGNF